MQSANEGGPPEPGTHLPMGVHRTRRGLDLPIAGDPELRIEAARAVTRVALVAADYVGLRPILHVHPGDRVLRGQALFEDKRNPGVPFVAPAAGRVAAVNRGDRRALRSIVIDVAEAAGTDPQVALPNFTGRPPADLDRDAARALLVESGLWTALRTRPFSRIPSPASVPQALFVTAIDTRPHAPAPELVLANRAEDFAAGVRVLEKLTDGPVFVCKAAGATIPVPDSSRLRVEEFAGPHPSGTAGLHIHLLHPVSLERSVWHVSYQDVAAIGRLVLTGRIDVERVVSLAGPGVARPRLLRTRLGASTDELAAGELRDGPQRVVSGSVLDGRAASGEVLGYLGRYHLQITALPEGHRREFMGWLAPGRDKFSVTNAFASAFARARRLALTTTTNGARRPLVPIGTYEDVMPMDIEPTFLLRALVTGDAERAEALGCLELDEEDLALCSFACPSKFDYGPLLRAALERIEREH
jgi:Na+-transporting NADH:ubiquinone oxidoreductase subunit A